MKLFVRNKTTGIKVSLEIDAQFRNDLRNYFNGDWFVFTNTNDNNVYNISEVIAEKSLSKRNGAALIGGAAGFFFGPGGMAIGAGLGAYAGNANEQKKVDRFNHSR